MEDTKGSTDYMLGIGTDAQKCSTCGGLSSNGMIEVTLHARSVCFLITETIPVTNRDSLFVLYWPDIPEEHRFEVGIILLAILAYKNIVA